MSGVARKCGVGIAFGVLLISCVSCRQSQKENEGKDAAIEKPKVLVVNYPLQYMAERIGGSLVDVQFPAPADEDPAYWEPTVDEITLYQQADVVLLNGAGYAGWTERVTLPESRLRLTTRTVSDQFIETDEAVVHQHGPQGEHEHTGAAFTTWLDPEIAVQQAREVHHALIDLLPNEASTLNANYDALKGDLLALDEQLASLTAKGADVPLVFSHPVYQYLVRRYDLKSRDVHWEPDAMPDEKAWEELQAMLAEHPAKWMVWEGEPLPDVVQRLKTLGVESVVFAPLGNRPAEGDYLSGMQANIDRLRSVFQP
jgi:zinc transport system substrate-binding protein